MGGASTTAEKKAIAETRAVVRTAIICDPRISSAKCHVTMALIEFANRETGRLWPSASTVAEMTGTTERTVRRTFAELRLFGYLRPLGKTGSGTTIYQLLLPLNPPTRRTPKRGRAKARRRAQGAQADQPAFSAADRDPPIVDDAHHAPIEASADEGVTPQSGVTLGLGMTLVSGVMREMASRPDSSVMGGCRECQAPPDPGVSQTSRENLSKEPLSTRALACAETRDEQKRASEGRSGPVRTSPLVQAWRELRSKITANSENGARAADFRDDPSRTREIAIDAQPSSVVGGGHFE
jgi:hypothetical protein